MPLFAPHAAPNAAPSAHAYHYLNYTETNAEIQKLAAEFPSLARAWGYYASGGLGLVLFAFGLYYSVAAVAENAAQYVLFGGECRLDAARGR